MPHGYGKTALITGASTGIGRELSLIFAEHGYDLVVVARSKDRLDALATEIYDAYGAQVTVMAKDLSKPAAPKQLFKAVQDAGLRIHVLVNNAGFGSVKPFAEDAQTRLSDMVQVNVGALTQLTRLFTAAMIKNGPDDKGDGGKVLNVASVAAFTPTPGMALYGATKAFVLSLTEALSEELREHSITVTALCPGLTETEFSKTATGKTGANGTVPDFMKLDATTVAREGFDALHAGEVVRINGLAYQLGVEWARLTPRAVVRTMSGLFRNQLNEGF